MYRDSVDSKIESMDLDRKIGQLWMANFCGDDSLEYIRDTLSRFHFGGAMLSVNYAVFRRGRTKIPNGVSIVKGPVELATWVERIQNIAIQETGAPLFIGADQEGGSDRSLLRRNGFTIVPSQMGLGSSQDAEKDTALATEIVGRELSASGFNMIYGPILDLDINPSNPEVGVRSFGKDPHRVARLGQVYIENITKNGVIACPKHFPGRGRGSNDAHFTLETITVSETKLKETDLIPFIENRHAPAIMVGHTVYPALDPDHPASLSSRVVTDLLRREVGFEGVILTDELTMWAIAHNYSIPEACIMALEAGVDMFFMKATEHFEAVQKQIHQSIKSGRITEERIDRSVRRVLKLKQLMRTGSPSEAASSIGSTEHQNYAQMLAQKTLSVTRGKDGMPLSRGSRILVIVPRDITVIQTNDGITTHDALPRELSRFFNVVDHIVIDEEVIDLQVFEAKVTARRADIVVLLISELHVSPSMHAIIDELERNIENGFNHRVVALVAHRPSVTAEIGSVVSTVLCSYCPGGPQYRTFAQWLSEKGNTDLTLKGGG